jgi:hypothetical protein
MAGTRAFAQTAAPAASAQAAKPVKHEPVTAEQDRQNVIDFLTKSGEDSDKLKDRLSKRLLSALTEALRGPQKTHGVKLSPKALVEQVRCHQAGCYLDVKEPKAPFLTALATAMSNPKGSFADWSGARYRSGLCKTADGLVITVAVLDEPKTGGAKK